MEKSSRKTSKRTAPGKPFVPGDPRIQRGNGPAKGAPNAGRPPDEWRERLRAMASRDEVLEHVNTVLMAGPEHPYFDRALQYVTDHGYGKPTQSVDLTTAGQALTVRFVHESAKRDTG